MLDWIGLGWIGMDWIVWIGWIGIVGIVEIERRTQRLSLFPLQVPRIVEEKKGNWPHVEPGHLPWAKTDQNHLCDANIL